MKSILTQLMIRTRRALWAILVSYMLGVHNFYNSDTRTHDDLNNRNKIIEIQDDGAPKE